MWRKAEVKKERGLKTMRVEFDFEKPRVNQVIT
jgi:hypothetical protein